MPCQLPGTPCISTCTIAHWWTSMKACLKTTKTGHWVCNGMAAKAVGSIRIRLVDLSTIDGAATSLEQRGHLTQFGPLGMDPLRDLRPRKDMIMRNIHSFGNHYVWSLRAATWNLRQHGIVAICITLHRQLLNVLKHIAQSLDMACAIRMLLRTRYFTSCLHNLE